MKTTALVCLSALTLILCMSLKKPKYKRFKEVWMPYEAMSEIPGGKYFYHDDSVQMNAYYMASAEVTNGQYREFVKYITAKGDQALVASRQWPVIAAGHQEGSYKRSGYRLPTTGDS